MQRKLVLEDGSEYVGKAVGGSEFKIGELVFSGGACGYQEAITNPALCGSILVSTYPLVGNAGINKDDSESLAPSLFGIVMKELCDTPNNGSMTMSLNEYLEIHNIAGIEGIDTRALVRKIRDSGSQKARFATMEEDTKSVVKELKSHKLESDLVSRVSCATSYSVPNFGHRVVLIDLGAKLGIIRELAKRSCDIVVVPYNTSAKEIMAFEPDAVVISSGPGDPRVLKDTIKNVKELLANTTVFGIGIGCQVVALASGATLATLAFGHRGSNYPVKRLDNGKVEITSEACAYTIDRSSLEKSGLVETYRSVNDGSVEGIKHGNYSAFGVAFNPEANPGPQDSNYIFDELIEILEQAGGEE